MCCSFGCDDLEGAYILPPVKYADGSYYLKLGHSGNIFEEVFETGEQMSDWYNNGKGDEKAVEQLSCFIKKIVEGKKTNMHVALILR